MRNISEKDFFVPNPAASISRKHEKRTEGITIFSPKGREAKTQDDVWACALLEKSQRGERYFIRTSARAELYDFSNPIHSENYSKRINGIDQWEMKEVKKAQFDNYLEYLETSNKIFYNQAKDVF